MIPVTIDPSETRQPAPQATRRSRPHLRPVLLSGLGLLGLAGFTALASSVLGGLAGPQLARASIKTAAVTQRASDWPDLRDGIPALAPVVTRPDRPSADPASPTIATPASSSPATPAAVSPPAVADRVEAPMPAPKPAVPAPKQAEAAPAPKPVRLPPIENAVVLPPARPAALVPVARSAALVAPSPAETTRSRATDGAFAALPPERETPRRKPAPAPVAQSAKPSPERPSPEKPAHEKAATAKPAPAKVASAAPAPAEADSEHTEVFGIKVPSLAPAGRKIAEGVEALGNAVKSLPDRF